MIPVSDLLVVAGGGAVGSVIRYLLALGSLKLPGGTTLAGTLVANLIGCFAIGLLSALILANPDSISPRVALGLRVGLLGGLTTFSTFAAESVWLAHHGQITGMTLYIAGTVLLGLLAVSAGTWLVGPPQEPSP
jgi:fluoride exporter